MNLIIVLGVFLLIGGLLLLSMAVFVYSQIQHDLLEDSSGVGRGHPPTEWTISTTAYLIGGIFLTTTGSSLIGYGIRSGSKCK